jgi:hypothetical protein
MKAIVILFGLLFLSGVHSQKPSNDECINATVIPANKGITTNYTTAPIEIKQASANPLDPITNCSYFSYDDPRGTDGVTLWFTWRPQQTGEYEFFTDGSTYADNNSNDADDFSFQGITTIIGVFEGNTCGVIEEIGCAFPFTKVRSIDLTGGVKYYIKVGMFQAFRGGTLRLTVQPAPPTPPNTECVKAISVDPTKQGLITGEITNALIDEASFPCADITFGFNKGLWYKFTNSFNSRLSLIISTCYDGTDFDSLISVFEGTDCGALLCIGNVDDVGSDCGTKAVYGFLASPLTTYYVLIQGFENSEGFFKLGFNASANYFALIDSETDRFIEPVGDSVNYGNVNSKLNIQAVFSDEASIGSVLVKFDNPARSFCEELPPFSVFWDTAGDYFDAKPAIPLGSHTVSATSYAQNGCSGTAGTTISKEFEVTGCFVEYSVYDVVSGCPIFYLYSSDFFIYNIDPIPCDVNIQVYAYCGFTVDTVQIELRDTATDKIVTSKTETTSPYFLFGNMGSDITAGSIGPGAYSIAAIIDGIEHKAVPFTVDNACVQS